MTCPFPHCRCCRNCEREGGCFIARFDQETRSWVRYHRRGCPLGLVVFS